MKLGLLIVLCTISFFSIAQDTLQTEETAIRSKGLIFDFGTSQFSKSPNGFDLKKYGSRAVNIYFFDRINPTSKHVIARIGVGFGLENYSFKNDISPLPVLDSTIFSSGNSIGIDSIEFKKSKLSLNHIDIPVEVIFQKNNNKGGLKLILGIKAGWTFDTHSKRVVKVNGSIVKEKIKADFNLNKIRYGLTARVMFKGFNFFYYHNLTPLFRDGRGPEINTYVAGMTISID